jgi:hypothetical protein
MGRLPNLRASTAAAILLGLAFVGASAYRAATQSIVHDEAWAWATFTRHGVGEALTNYNAANHVLQTALSAISIRIFGTSELSLRLPSLLAAILLAAASIRVAHQMFEKAAVRLVWLLVLFTNGMIGDYAVAARGYGLGTALVMGAMVLAYDGRYRTAGVLGGLAVAANVSFAFPVAGLWVVWALWGERRTVVLQAAAASVAVFGVVAGWALRGARAEDFAVKSGDWFQSAATLARDSFWGIDARVSVLGGGDAAAWVGPLAGLLAVGAGFVYLLAERQKRALDRTDGMPLWLVVSTVLITAGAMVLGTGYPVDRTGLYLVPMASATVALCVERWWEGRTRATAALLAGGLAVVCVQQGLQWKWDGFNVWRYDRQTREAYRLLSREAGEWGSLEFRNNWHFEPAWNFYWETDPYRVLGRASRQQPVDLKGAHYALLRGEDLGRGRIKVLLGDEAGDSFAVRLEDGPFPEAVPVANRGWDQNLFFWTVFPAGAPGSWASAGQEGGALRLVGRGPVGAFQDLEGLRGGAWFVVRAWTRRQAGNKGVPVIYAHDHSQRPGFEVTVEGAAADEWRVVELRYWMPESCGDRCRLRVHLMRAAGDEGATLWDSVRVMRVTGR